MPIDLVILDQKMKDLLIKAESFDIQINEIRTVRKNLQDIRGKEVVEKQTDGSEKTVLKLSIDGRTGKEFKMVDRDKIWTENLARANVILGS